MNGSVAQVERCGRVVVVTGADSNYYWLLEGAIRSLLPIRDKFGVDLVSLDFGLDEVQKATLRDEHQVRVVSPPWLADVPDRFKVPRNLAFGVRFDLPIVVPGYDIYAWFDSDGWVQDEAYFEQYIGTAAGGALAVVREEEPVYPFDWGLLRWNLGNQLLGFGPVGGARVFASPSINNGFFAAKADHPVWGLWRRRYESAVRRSGKIIMDQHSLRAVIALDRVETVYLTGKSNWICSRARPLYDRDRGCFCVPYPPYEKIAVMHLAGPGKGIVHDLRCVDGGSYRTVLTWQDTHRLSVR